MTRVRRPAQLEILGVPFSVTWNKRDMPVDSREDCGETTAWEHKMQINSERCGDRATIDSTLLHEIIHAVLYLSGHHASLLGEDVNKEEGLVLALENGLYPVI